MARYALLLLGLAGCVGDIMDPTGRGPGGPHGPGATAAILFGSGGDAEPVRDPAFGLVEVLRTP